MVSAGHTATITTRMTDAEAIQILAAWFSPAYPVGGFSYSHGLEQAVATGLVSDRDSLQTWTADLLAFGSGRSDAVLLCRAHREADPGPVSEMAEALCPSAERNLETTAQGAAFARTTAAAWNIPVPAMAYPVAVGHAARQLELPLAPLVTLFLQAFAANVVSAGLRLIPLGQTDGQRITAALMPLAAKTAAAAMAADPEDIGGVALGADLASMLHETMETRLFRS